MARNFDSVLFKIQYIVSTLCNDDILQRKWQSELEWFQKFEETKHIEYWNLAPEAIMSLRWRKLEIVLETCISSRAYSDWEQRIVDIFVANDTGEDLPEPTDVYPINIQEDYYAENCDNPYPYDYAENCDNDYEHPYPYNYEKKCYEDEYEHPYALEMEEERALGRQEEAASRNDERKGYY